MNVGDRVRVKTKPGSLFYRRALRISRTGTIESFAAYRLAGAEIPIAAVRIRHGMKERPLGRIIVPIDHLAPAPQ